MPAVDSKKYARRLKKEHAARVRRHIQSVRADEEYRRQHSKRQLLAPDAHPASFDPTAPFNAEQSWDVWMIVGHLPPSQLGGAWEWRAAFDGFGENWDQLITDCSSCMPFLLAYQDIMRTSADPVVQQHYQCLVNDVPMVRVCSFSRGSKP
jgi:hypothetical protein